MNLCGCETNVLTKKSLRKKISEYRNVYEFWHMLNNDTSNLFLRFIGFVIYQLKEPDSTELPLQKEFFQYNSSCARSASFINSRELTGRFQLNPGTYIIIPSTFEPEQEGDFILRIFSEKMANVEQVSWLYSFTNVLCLKLH